MLCVPLLKIPFRIQILDLYRNYETGGKNRGEWLGSFWIFTARGMGDTGIRCHRLQMKADLASSIFRSTTQKKEKD